MEAYEQFQHDVDALGKGTLEAALALLKGLSKGIDRLDKQLKHQKVDGKFQEVWDKFKDSFQKDKGDLEQTYEEWLANHKKERGGKDAPEQETHEQSEEEIDFEELDQEEEQALEEAVEEFEEDMNIDELEEEIEQEIVQEEEIDMEYEPEFVQESFFDMGENADIDIAEEEIAGPVLGE